MDTAAYSRHSRRASLTSRCVNARTVTTLVFFFNDTATTEIYTLSLHDALPIWPHGRQHPAHRPHRRHRRRLRRRSEEHTSELQSPDHLVCRLLLEKKKKKNTVLARPPPDLPPLHCPLPACFLPLLPSHCPHPSA